jgi:hypothetical protein
MSAALLRWLDDASDRLSAIAVKEVRQVVRSREFTYAFFASLVAAVAIAFFGAADALTGNGTSGTWTFVALMVCLTLLGLTVVPLGAFNALRTERMEQTLDLITITALSPRRVVTGKLMAQVVKLVTFFAAVAPFMAMSFLLGGIDFITILISLGVLFMLSLWTSAAFLFLSTLPKSRTMSGIVFGAAGFLVIFVLLISRIPMMLVAGGGRGGMGAMSLGGSRASMWWGLAIMASACLMTLVNLVLLAENRLAVPTVNRVTPLRIGFLAQFLVLAGWVLTYVGKAPRVQEDAIGALGVIGGLHLGLVALFAVTEDLVLPRRALLEMQHAGPRDWLLAPFRPGGGRGAAWVLAQMALLVATGAMFSPDGATLRWLVAICAYVCFFTGIPAFFYRWARPRGTATLKLRVAELLLLPLALTLPDVLYYVVGQPVVFDLGFGVRHLMNPFRTLANWRFVESSDWSVVPFALGLAGLVAYLGIIQLGARITAEDLATAAAPAPIADGEPGSADALY